LLSGNRVNDIKAQDGMHIDQVGLGYLSAAAIGHVLPAAVAALTAVHLA